MKKVLKSSLISLSAFALSTMPVLAQGTTTTTTNLNETVVDDFAKIVNTFVNWAAILAGVIALGYLIYAGIKYITSAGDPGKTEEAQKQIVSAIIGLAIVVLAYALMKLVSYLLGVGFGIEGLKGMALDSLLP